MEFKSPYKKLDRKVNTWCNYIQRLDTYGCGCQHDCSYCYAKSLLSFRGLWNAIEPSTASILEIKNKIKNINRHDIVRMGGMTDCFQPIEIRKRITYNTILWLNHYKIHYLIVTKSSLVTNPEYLKIYDKNLAHFQITITTTKDNTFEKASKINDRIKSVELLQSLGFDVSVRLSPFMFEMIDFEKINGIKCDKILIEFLKVNHNVKKWFDINYDEYSLKYGGFNHLNIDRKIELVSKIKLQQITVGEYVKDHHEYFSNHVNHNKNDCCNLNYTKPENTMQAQLF